MVPTPVKTSARGRYTSIVEASLAQGPGAVGVTGIGDFQALYGYLWALLLEVADFRLHLYAVNGTQWDHVGIVSLQGGDSGEHIRHIGLGFDQAARPVVAYEVEQAEMIRVRQWDPVSASYVYRGPYVGVDPLVFVDSTIGVPISESDVSVIYQDIGRSGSIRARVQREVFATQHILGQASGLAPLYLDLLTPLPYTYQIHVGGEYASQPSSLRGGLSGIHLGPEQVVTATAVGPSAGVYFPVVIVQPAPPTEQVATATAVGPSAGVYFPVVIVQPAPATEQVVTASAVGPSAGNYALIVIVQAAPATEQVTTATALGPSAGTYALIVIVQPAPATEQVAAATAIGPSGGTYVAG